MTDTDTSDFLRRAGYALHDMQGRVEDRKLEMFWECIKRLEALSAALEDEKAEGAKFRKGWSLAVDQCDKEYARAEAAEAERDALKAELAEAVGALNQYQLAAAGYVSVQSARDKADAFLARHPKDTDT